MKIPAKYAIALTAALGLFMAVLDNTVINVALTPMARTLNSDLNFIQWVVTGYFLAQAAVIPASGYFGTRFGLKRVFILCLTFFTIGSLLCGLAQDATMLVIFRVLQGLGGGALFPLAQAISFRSFAPEERAGANAVVALPVFVAPILGPTVGGFLTDNFGWSYIFLINVPVGILAALLAWRIFPTDKIDRSRVQGNFDYIGLALSILGVLAVVYGFTLVNETRPGTATPLNPNGDPYGWGYWMVWAMIALGIALLTAFAIYALRFSKDPVLDLRLYQKRDFTIASLVSWAGAMTVFGSLFLLPVFLQQVRTPHLSAMDAGIAMAPQGIAAAIITALSGRLYNTIGVRMMAVAGAVSLIISSWQLSQLTPSTTSLELAPWIAMRGLGFGLALIPVQTLALQTITGPALAKASSLFNVTRQIASSIGIAALATLFGQQTSQHIGEIQGQALQQLPQGTQLDLTNPQIAALRDQVLATAGTQAMNDVFRFVTIGLVVVLLLALALPSRPRTSEVTSHEGEHAQQPRPVME